MGSQSIACKGCGQGFVRPVGGMGRLRLYCSALCRVKPLRAHGALTCKACGKVFESDRRRKYCGLSECSWKHGRQKGVRPAKCARCGTGLRSLTQGRPRVFCEDCRLAKNRERVRLVRYVSPQRTKSCKQCGKEFLCDGRATFCSLSCAGKAQRKLPALPCEQCGSSFRPHGSRQKRFCSRECAFKFKATRATGRKASSFSKVYFPNCGICGISFCTKRSCVTICSVDCRKERERRRAREADAARHGAAREALYASRKCVECGKEFVPTKHRGPPRSTYCSKRCGQKPGRRIRKARESGAVKVEPIYWSKVFERDKGICQLCGRYTVNARVPHLLAPTLDHIIPLSCGGSHTMDNVHIAHFECNVSKQDAPLAHWANGRMYKTAEALLVAA